MRNRSTIYRFTLGLLLGALIMPAQPAHAQFGGIVFDAKNYALQVKKGIEDARRHLDTFNNAVKTWTTMRGVLGEAEKLVTDRFVSKKTMSDLGILVRTCFQLKDQAEAIIKSRLTMLESIDNRLKSGILDPERDLRDLEDYLTTSIGRRSEDSLANLERLRRMDNTLERATRDLRKAQVGLATTKAELDLLLRTRQQMEKAPQDLVSSEAMANIDEKIATCRTLITTYEGRIPPLITTIEERKKIYSKTMDARTQFGQQVKRTNRGWGRLTEKLREIEGKLQRP